jgi:hypothetical protein
VKVRVAEGVIGMWVALAFALLLVPLAVLFVFERTGRAGEEPSAEPDGKVVFEGTVVPVGGHVVALVDPWRTAPANPSDNESCAVESRLVAALIGGELDRSQYQEQMAELAAADAVMRPVRLPREPS